jgi:hypothetical protein
VQFGGKSGEPMDTENSKGGSLKQKAAHELEQFIGIFLYLSFFFCSVVTYARLLLNDPHISYFNYGAALINALVIAKVILIGEYARLGKRYEAKPLLFSAVYKAFLFGLLVLGFHILEAVIKRLLHGEKLIGAFRDARIEDLLANSLVIVCTFIPFFAFRELSRVLGEDRFRELFLRSKLQANLP